MKFISESSEIESAETVGGKGSHLQKLVSWGAPVAPFFVLTTDSFNYFQKYGKIPEVVSKRMIDFFQSHPVIAIRSSMTSEDHVDSSFAGLFETILNVNSENWEKAVLQIYSSINSDRVKEYISRKKMVVDFQMAVVIQEQIDVDRSGVLFTRSPVEPTGAVAIDAAHGMGEAVVSGHTDVDHYLYTRTFGPIKESLHQGVPVLTEEERKELISLSLNLESKLKTPADIEWGIKEGRFYIFQIRPITRSFEPLKYFVDTNLSESYPGVVSPLTAAFVKKAYETVFRESAVLMGAKGKKLDDLNRHYPNLISSVDNHLYYNLEHYYAVLRALPGGERNIDNWHMMIGGKINNIDIPYHATTLTRLETVWTLLKLGELILTRKQEFSRFLNALEKQRTKIEQDFSGLNDSKEIMKEISRISKSTHGFGLTVVNDVFIMMGLGILSRVVRKKGFKEEVVIDLLKTTEGLDSIKPLEAFNELVKDLSDDFIDEFGQADLTPGLNAFVNTFHSLEGKWPKEVSELRRFLELYGDRSFEELKIESLPMKNNPSLVHHLLLWAKHHPVTPTPKASHALNLKLGWLSNKVLVFTRECIAMREATRLWRGKYYHLLRLLVLNLGETLKAEESSWKKFSVYDFFSLSPDEWKQFSQGRFTQAEVENKINVRKNWQMSKKQYPEIIPWVENEPLPEISVEVTRGELHGQGVSPGITEATALVLENPFDALESDLQNFILVTKNTDPAWVYIMSRSQGLISEKGSLLSHTAIIGRELGIPTIVGVKFATQKLKTGDRLRIDATLGTIEKIWA